MSVKNLAEILPDEQQKYINSFDTVLLDLDGVVWINYIPVPGAVNCINSLKRFGKNVHYVTNNSLVLGEVLLEKLKENKFNAEISDIINPIQTLTCQLKILNVSGGEIYVIGNKLIKDQLKQSGYKVLPDPPGVVDESLDSFLMHNDGKKVGAVIFDIDFNLSYLKLQKALWFLQNNENCYFLVTQREKAAPVGPRGSLLGMFHLADALKDLSGRNFIETGKPSVAMTNYIKEKYDITDTNRVLFIGNSIQSDMATAAKGGYQKLLVLNGAEKITNVNYWSYPPEYKPEYFVENLGILNGIFDTLFNEYLTRRYH